MAKQQLPPFRLAILPFIGVSQMSVGSTVLIDN